MENNDKSLHVFMKDMVHPVRSRLFAALHSRKQATAGELAQALSDVPQATLYRHLSRMVEHGVLKIVAQRKKRALYENVYAIAIDFDGSIDAMLRENRGDVYAAMFFQYMLALYKEFQAYAERPDIDIANDGSGFSMGPVYATNEELTQILTEVSVVLEKYNYNAHPPDTARKMRTIGLIITPPKDPEDTEQQ